MGTLCKTILALERTFHKPILKFVTELSLVNKKAAIKQKHSCFYNCALKIFLSCPKLFAIFRRGLSALFAKQSTEIERIVIPYDACNFRNIVIRRF